jgi:hypothetical protein
MSGKIAILGSDKTGALQAGLSRAAVEVNRKQYGRMPMLPIKSCPPRGSRSCRRRADARVWASWEPQKAKRGYLKNNFSERWNWENQGAFPPRNPRDVPLALSFGCEAAAQSASTSATGSTAVSVGLYEQPGVFDRRVHDWQPGQLFAPDKDCP